MTAGKNCAGLLSQAARLTGQFFQGVKSYALLRDGSEPYEVSWAEISVLRRVTPAWMASVLNTPASHPARAAMWGPAQYTPIPARAPTPRATRMCRRKGFRREKPFRAIVAT